VARPVERRAGRDFVLDAHGLTALAAPSALANEWLEYIFEERPGSEVWVPDLVIVESTTGTPADANVNRFLKTLGSTKESERHWLSADEASYRRAAELRTLALKANDDIAVTDAVVVAHAEVLSERRGVSILTSDPGDLNLLVHLTNRRNISVIQIDGV